MGNGRRWQAAGRPSRSESRPITTAASISPRSQGGRRPRRGPRSATPGDACALGGRTAQPIRDTCWLLICRLDRQAAMIRTACSLSSGVQETSSPQPADRSRSALNRLRHTSSSGPVTLRPPSPQGGRNAPRAELAHRSGSPSSAKRRGRSGAWSPTAGNGSTYRRRWGRRPTSTWRPGWQPVKAHPTLRSHPSLRPPPRRRSRNRRRNTPRTHEDRCSSVAKE